MPKDCEVCKRYDGCKRTFSEPQTDPLASGKWSCTQFKPDTRPYLNKYGDQLKYRRFGCPICGEIRLQIDDKSNGWGGYCGECKTQYEEICSYLIEPDPVTCNKCSNKFVCFTNKVADVESVSLWGHSVTDIFEKHAVIAQIRARK